MIEPKSVAIHKENTITVMFSKYLVNLIEPYVHRLSTVSILSNINGLNTGNQNLSLSLADDPAGEFGFNVDCSSLNHLKDEDNAWHLTTYN